MRTNRQREYRILNNRSPEQYWSDSEQRWLSYIPPRRKKEWQSRVVKPITRDRCVGIIATMLSNLLEPEFFAALDGEISQEVAKAMNDLYDLSQAPDKYEQK